MLKTTFWIWHIVDESSHTYACGEQAAGYSYIRQHTGNARCLDTSANSLTKYFLRLRYMVQVYNDEENSMASKNINIANYQQKLKEYLW